MSMGASRKRARELADELLNVGSIKAEPKVEEKGTKDSVGRVKKMKGEIKTLKGKMVTLSQRGAEAASARIKTLQDRIDALHNKNLSITTNYVSHFSSVGSRAGGRGDSRGSATGGLITGPGTATSDSIPARLSTGEYVVRAAAVDRYGAAFMNRVNSMSLAGGGIVGYARGGRARTRQPYGTATIRDYANGLEAGFNASTVARNLERIVRRDLSGRAERLQLRKLDALDKKLAAVVAANNRVASALAARDKLVEQRGTFRENIRTAITPDISQFGQTRGGIAAGLSTQRGAATTFIAKLNALKAAGFPNELISQVAGLGLTDGAAAATQLLALNRTDRAGVIGDFNALAAYSESQSAALSNSFYKASIDGANAYLARMQAQQRSYNAIFATAADAFATQLAGALHIDLTPGRGGRRRRRRRHDSGGWLSPGVTEVENYTGKPEPVLTAGQWQQMERLISAVERGQVGGGAPLIGNAVIRETVDLASYERQRAYRDRMTRV
jgi:polyhydroxyalkanoate synthesis regulator phasin